VHVRYTCIVSFILSYLVHAMEPFFYPYIVSLVALRNFCRYFIGMTDKARRATNFMSWYR
jgi:hypothetical protein